MRNILLLPIFFGFSTPLDVMDSSSTKKAIETAVSRLYTASVMYTFMDVLIHGIIRYGKYRYYIGRKRGEKKILHACSAIRN